VKRRREKEWDLKQNLIKEELPELDERLIETQLGGAAKVRREMETELGGAAKF